MTKPVTRKMAVDCLLDRIWCDAEYHGSMNGRQIIFLFCGVCKKPLIAGQDIQFDHVHADVFDGPHEYQNLRPVHAECHKIKTKADVQANAKIKRILRPRKSRRPMPKSGRKIPSRQFQTKR